MHCRSRRSAVENAIDIADELYDEKTCYKLEQTAMREEVLERLANASTDDETLTISTDWYRNELDLPLDIVWRHAPHK